MSIRPEILSDGPLIIFCGPKVSDRCCGFKNFAFFFYVWRNTNQSPQRFSTGRC